MIKAKTLSTSRSEPHHLAAGQSAESTLRHPARRMLDKLPCFRLDHTTKPSAEAMGFKGGVSPPSPLRRRGLVANHSPTSGRQRSAVDMTLTSHAPVAAEERISKEDTAEGHEAARGGEKRKAGCGGEAASGQIVGTHARTERQSNMESCSASASASTKLSVSRIPEEFHAYAPGKGGTNERRRLFPSATPTEAEVPRLDAALQTLHERWQAQVDARLPFPVEHYVRGANWGIVQLLFLDVELQIEGARLSELGLHEVCRHMRRGGSTALGPLLERLRSEQASALATLEALFQRLQYEVEGWRDRCERAEAATESERALRYSLQLREVHGARGPPTRQNALEASTKEQRRDGLWAREGASQPPDAPSLLGREGGDPCSPRAAAALPSSRLPELFQHELEGPGGGRRGRLSPSPQAPSPKMANLRQLAAGLSRAEASALHKLLAKRLGFGSLPGPEADHVSGTRAPLR